MDDNLSNVLDTGSRVIDRAIEDELRDSFIDYSMSVIVQRALPDARDGLKPVHRRILYSMSELGLLPSRPHKKSATVVGDVLGKYHPHGDTAVYDSLVRMVQTFSLAEPLIDGQGNYGSLDGDAAAAYRYTEAKLSPIALELLEDIDKETVDFAPNFDDRLMEPKVLPSRIPNLLLNGSTGIAVGMATNIPPHNLTELASVIELLCENPNVDDDAIYSLVEGPDFPTGAMVLSDGGIKNFLQKGVGRIVMRGRVHLEKAAGGRTSIIITEIPYQVLKKGIVEKIAELHKEKKIEGIADLRDESDRDGIAIRVELKRDTDPKKTVDKLYKYTDLQKTFGAKLLALVEGQPKVLSFRKAVEIFIKHRLEVIIRRSSYDLKRAKAELHILEGLLIAIASIDRVIQIVRESRTSDSAKNKLLKEFNLSMKQAEAILNLRLYKLTALSISDIKKNVKELQKSVEALEELLSSPDRQRKLVRDETREIAATYGRPRRTQIVSVDEAENISQQAAEEYVNIYVTSSSLAWSEPVGKRARGRVLESSDPAIFAVRAPSNEKLVVMGTSGNFYPLEVEGVPGSGNRPRSLPSIIQGMDKKDFPLWISNATQLGMENLSILFITEKGQIKRTAASEYAKPKAGGVSGIGLTDDDRIIASFFALPGHEVFVATSQGQMIRFALDGVPEQGRVARGVKAVRLTDDDRVVAAGTVTSELGFISRNGYVKKVSLEEFPLQGRGGSGVKIVRSIDKTGDIVWVGPVSNTRALWVQTSTTREAILTEAFPVANRASLGDIHNSLQNVVKVESTPEMLVDRLVKKLSETGSPSEETPMEDTSAEESISYDLQEASGKEEQLSLV